MNDINGINSFYKILKECKEKIDCLSSLFNSTSFCVNSDNKDVFSNGEIIAISYTCDVSIFFKYSSFDKKVSDSVIFKNILDNMHLLLSNILEHIDFKEIFRHKKEAGLKYFFVEEDKCPGSPFDSITQSYSYIKKSLV